MAGQEGGGRLGEEGRQNVGEWPGRGLGEWDRILLESVLDVFLNLGDDAITSGDKSNLLLNGGLCECVLLLASSWHSSGKEWDINLLRGRRLLLSLLFIHYTVRQQLFKLQFRREPARAKSVTEKALFSETWLSLA